MIAKGMTIPEFVKGSARTLLSASEANNLVGVANAITNMRIQSGDRDSVDIVDGCLVLTLKNGTGTGDGYWNTSQSYTASCPSGSNGDSVTVTVAAETVGSKTSVADANSMALELATSRALASLTCETTESIQIGTGEYDFISKIVQVSGTLYVIGTFFTAGGYRRYSICALDSSLHLLKSDWFCDGLIKDIYVASPYLYICGEFSQVNGSTMGWKSSDPLIASAGLAKLVIAGSSIGEVDRAFSPSATAYSFGPSCILPVTEYDIQTFGSSYWDGATLNSNLKFLSNGTRDTTYTGAAVNGGVSAVHHAGSGIIYIVGSFTTVNSTSRNGIACILSGALYGFDPGTGFSGTNFSVHCIAPCSGGLIVGGQFTGYNGTTCSNLVILDYDASIDTGFLPTFDGPVHSVCVQDDGKFLVGGGFSNVNSTARRGLARLNADGTLDTTFSCDVLDDYGSGNVLTIVTQTSGNIVIGGLFRSVHGVSRRNIARINSTGSVLG